LFGLEIQDKETNPYAAGNPQEGYNNREVNSLINFDASPGWVATLASFMTKAPTTWSKKEAYFKDYNSKGVVALNIGNGCPWVPLTYKADGSAVQAVDKIADFDQPWYSVVGGVAKPMGGKVKAHHVTLLYKYVVRNIGGLAYPETPPG
jgi:hypothetical protein